MSLVEHISVGMDDTQRLVLSCSHVVYTKHAHVKVGQPWECLKCAADKLMPTTPAMYRSATDAQLDAIAAEYEAVMTERGIAIGPAERTAIRRAAAIHDAWRVAFAKIVS